MTGSTVAPPLLPNAGADPMDQTLAPTDERLPPWVRLHRQLMPDYNRKAAGYWWCVVLLGAAIIARALVHLAGLPATAWIQIVVATGLAMAAGLVPVRIPRSTNSFTAGEIFIFLLLLMSGPEAAALASASEALVGAWRSSKRWTSRIASPAMAAIAMYVAGSALQGVLALQQRFGVGHDALLLLAAILFAFGYFLLNTLLVTMLPRLKRNEPLNLKIFVDSFGWLGIAYAGNASVATFLYLSFRQSGIVVVIAAVPIIVILLTTGHYFFRREEAEEAVRKAREQQAAQRQLLENARTAGMAEIATNVLHNVGNVLNSVNVSTELISTKLRESEVTGLARAVQLLEDHAHEIGDYLTNDKRGRLLPHYLKQLAQTLEEERQGMAAELAALARNVKHIKEIVTTQQAYAGASSIVEPVQILDLVEDALRIDTGALLGHEVQVLREFERVPALMLDKHRVLLILVNLIGNARYAMQRVSGGVHQLTLRVQRVDDSKLQIVVADTGEGIAAENLARIFAHGFTTKKDGHGFGLHSCVLAAREMGGTLQAASPGIGHGAVFTLELPLQEPTDACARAQAEAAAPEIS
ncbi:MAG TPA: ATP-binding protein [Ideonella sp.]|uniref:sensor histidine kinase n=1 Tax=Ideonella sp. TaxID=1929293 RepID=UPI002E33CECB|nr:ATP-binding protein [Ideonella sp.]HEX5686884.1 ATP-binding protein [Ideonella sp.]